MLTLETTPTTRMTVMQLQEIRRQLGLLCVNGMIKSQLIHYIKCAQAAI